MKTFTTVAQRQRPPFRGGLPSYIVGVLLGTAVFLTATLTQAEDTTVWRMAYLNAPKSGFAAMVEALPKRLAKVTAERLQVQTSSTILEPLQHLSAVKSGRVQAVTVVHPYYSAEAPILNVAGLPGLITTFEQFDNFSSAFMYDAFAKIFQERYNAILVAHGAWPGQVIWSNKPIRTVADFKGIKVRASNIETAQLLAKLGAKPIGMPFSEVIPALEQGIVDAIMTSPSTGYGVGLQQVTKYMNDWPLNFTVSWSIVINREAWKALPDDLKPKIAAEFKAIQMEYAADVGDEFSTGVQNAVEAGVEIITPSPAELAKTRDAKLLNEIFDDWNRRNTQQGFDGRPLLKELQEMVRSSD